MALTAMAEAEIGKQRAKGASYSTKTLLEALGDKFLVGDGCWEWTGKKGVGYGQLRRGNKIVGAHRIMYELFVGPIPDGLEIDHLCRNPGCVRPSHLEAVTGSENVLRGLLPETNRARWAKKTHCIHGHLYDEANTAIYSGHRFCRECRRLRDRIQR